jgi:hypothetical protein
MSDKLYTLESSKIIKERIEDLHQEIRTLSDQLKHLDMTSAGNHSKSRTLRLNTISKISKLNKEISELLHQESDSTFDDIHRKIDPNNPELTFSELMFGTKKAIEEVQSESSGQLNSQLKLERQGVSKIPKLVAETSKSSRSIIDEKISSGVPFDEIIEHLIISDDQIRYEQSFIDSINSLTESDPSKRDSN